MTVHRVLLFRVVGMVIEGLRTTRVVDNMLAWFIGAGHVLRRRSPYRIRDTS